GAQRKQLISQFLGESLFITSIAFVLALVVVTFVTPVLNNFIGREIELNLQQNIFMFLGLLVILVLVGLISGSYPALYLSAYRPISVLKNASPKGSGSSRFRSILVVFQFSISIALIICIGIVFGQLQFLHTKDLGYNKEQIVLLPGDERIMEKMELVKTRLLQ
ncbi:unnamed protein product, partial [marine sediment metagenome]